MNVSVVIPFHYAQEGKEDVLRRCTDSLTGYEELIIIGNDGKGVCWALNIGMRAARGDFIIILNDDTILRKGSLDQLCFPGVVTHPTFDGVAKQFGSCICYPREVYDVVGEYDEGYRFGYYEDDDILRRVEEEGFPRKVISAVDLEHPNPGLTLGALDVGDFGGWNMNHYLSKWGEYKQLGIPEVI